VTIPPVFVAFPFIKSSLLFFLCWTKKRAKNTEHPEINPVLKEDGVGTVPFCSIQNTRLRDTINAGVP
jgi:hypothetical protein